MFSIPAWLADLTRTLISGGPGQSARQLETTLAGGVRELKQWLLNHVIESVVTATLATPNEASPWSCPRCGPRLGGQLRLNGSYKRRPLTLEGPVQLRIPQLLCRDCGKAVPFELPCLGRRSRVWLDVTHKVVKDYMLGHSYRLVG